jgi:hypothetical protein
MIDNFASAYSEQSLVEPNQMLLPHGGSESNSADYLAGFQPMTKG